MTTAAELHRPFRPWATRWVCLVLGVLVVVGAVPIMVVVPQMPGVTFAPDDVVTGILFILGLLWLLWRQGMVRAVPDERGLTVRNFIHTRVVEWNEIVGVTFGGGNPWVLLDLSDGETLAVMAIQRADGARAVEESRRLATLVALHEPSP